MDMVNPGHNLGPLLKTIFCACVFHLKTTLNSKGQMDANGIRDLLSFAKNICGSNLMIKSQCP